MDISTFPETAVSQVHTINKSYTLPMHRSDDNGVLIGQALQDNFSFVLGYITSMLIFLINPEILSHPFKILNHLS